MVVQMQLMLTACIVFSAVEFGRAYDQVASDQATDDVQENLHNFFDSIANNNARKGDQYRGMLRDEVAMEQRAFDAMNKELRTSRTRNLRGHRNAKVADRNTVRKREISLVPKNITTETWDDVESLTPETLREICDQVFVQFRDNEFALLRKTFEYKPVDATELQIMRVIRSAPFKCSTEEEGLTVAVCLYDKYKFFVAPAGDKHYFFRLRQDEHCRFALKSGLHPVNWK